MNKEYNIYKIENDINNLVYIGVTTKTLQERFKQHCIDAKREKYKHRPLYVAMNSYGFIHFHIENIETLKNANENYALDREVFWIKQFNSYRKGYNSTAGGNGKTLYDCSDYEKVIKHYEKVKCIKKVSKELHMDAGSISKILQENGVEIIKQSDRVKKPIQMYSKDRNICMTFDSIQQGCRYIIENKHTQSTEVEIVHIVIRRALNGKRKTAYGFIWKFID